MSGLVLVVPLSWLIPAIVPAPNGWIDALPHSLQISVPGLVNVSESDNLQRLENQATRLSAAEPSKGTAEGATEVAAIAEPDSTHLQSDVQEEEASKPKRGDEPKEEQPLQASFSAKLARLLDQEREKKRGHGVADAIVKTQKAQTEVKQLQEEAAETRQAKIKADEARAKEEEREKRERDRKIRQAEAEARREAKKEAASKRAAAARESDKALGDVAALEEKLKVAREQAVKEDREKWRRVNQEAAQTAADKKVKQAAQEKAAKEAAKKVEEAKVEAEAAKEAARLAEERHRVAEKEKTVGEAVRKVAEINKARQDAEKMKRAREAVVNARVAARQAEKNAQKAARQIDRNLKRSEDNLIKVDRELHPARKNSSSNASSLEIHVSTASSLEIPGAVSVFRLQSGPLGPPPPPWFTMPEFIPPPAPPPSSPEPCSSCLRPTPIPTEGYVPDAQTSFPTDPSNPCDAVSTKTACLASLCGVGASDTACDDRCHCNCEARYCYSQAVQPTDVAGFSVVQGERLPHPQPQWYRWGGK